MFVNFLLFFHLLIVYSYFFDKIEEVINKQKRHIIEETLTDEENIC